MELFSTDEMNLEDATRSIRELGDYGQIATWHN